MEEGKFNPFIDRKYTLPQIKKAFKYAEKDEK